jgi:hypothetical protein
MQSIRKLILAAICLAVTAQAAGAQTVTQTPSADEGWQVTVYPVLAWVPLHIGIDVNVPPISSGGGGGGGGDEGDSAKIIDSRFDGAFFGGVSASNGTWRIEGYGLWAAIGGDRAERPHLTVDVDLLYGSAKLGRAIAPDFYVTGGVRRVALDYDILLGNLPRFTRKPGVWDPVVGVGWHRQRRFVEWHATFDGGGFGVGADVDLGASFSVDFKPIRHFGLTAGYNYLYLKVSDTVVNRDLILKLTAHGPTAGIGFYF